MKGEDLSKLQDPPVDTISVDFIAILTQLVEDNDSLQKRIHAVEKSDLSKRVEALEKSFILFKIGQQENADLQASMSKLISMLQRTDLHRGRMETKKEDHKSVNHVHNEFVSGGGRSESLNVSSDSCKRFKTGDEKFNTSCKHYRDGSSLEDRTISPSRHKYDDGRSRLFNKSGKHANSEQRDRYLDHHSRHSYDAERLNHERCRIGGSHRNSTHNDTKLAEERHYIVERSNSSKHRKRPQREDRQSSENSLRENRDSKQPHELDGYPLGESKDSKQLSSYDIKERKTSRQYTDHRTKEKRESKQLTNGRSIQEGKESKQLNNYRVKENTIKRNTELKPLSDICVSENNESKQPSDCHMKENELSKRSSDRGTNANRERKQPSDCHVNQNKDSKQPNNSSTRKSRESKPNDGRLSEGELSGDDRPRENEDPNRNNSKSSEHKNDCTFDSKLDGSIPSLGNSGVVDFKRIYSTPSKLVSRLPSFRNNCTIISPLPTPPDQLKEKFKEQGTVKVSPTLSFLNDTQFKAEKVHQSKEEVKKAIEVQLEMEDCVEVQTVTETDDVEHGIFKRRRKTR